LLPKKFGPAHHLAKAVPPQALVQPPEKTIVFLAMAIRAGSRPGPDLPGAADFAGLFTVR
jgi:hypothetical protein